MGKINLVRWSSSSAGHTMMGATLESHPPNADNRGAALRRQRTAHRLSGKQVGAFYRGGVTKPFISKIETFVRVAPDIAHDLRVAIRLAADYHGRLLKKLSEVPKFRNPKM